MAALVLDTAADDRFKSSESLAISGVRSILAAPLLDPDGPLGMIVLMSTLVVKEFTEEELALLVSLASVAALKIRNVNLAEEAEERRRLARELALARRIQEALLPAELPELPGWELHAENVPSRGVSGDYYSVRLFDDGHLVLLLADVSGKGIGASLLTASLEALAEAPIEDRLPPDEVFLRLSRGIFRRTPPEKYATAFLVVADLRDGTLQWANAGHCPGILVRGGGTTERLGPTGLPLGLLGEGTYETRESRLQEGDLLYLYTDGITEAENPEGEELGSSRLETELVRSGGRPAAEVATRIEDLVSGFARGIPIADDRTVLVLRRCV
jgi:sigma-B regulation protein RsbU (phosphoserine phosphatase)